MAKNELSNMDIALYVLDGLGGISEKVPTEEIALKCFHLAPARFSWILHSEYPDLEPVRKALFSARSEERKCLVAGRHGKTKENQVSDGWIFTPKGINWIEKNKKRIEMLLNLKKETIKRTQTDKQIFGFKNSIAFKKFLRDKGCKNIAEFEFTDFLNASLDTPTSILYDRIDQIRAIAAVSKEQKIIDFIDSAQIFFHNLLKR